MSEFWKSNPKKYCEFCKCWFADNKSSIDFHERGKRHKENVERKIGELRKKGLEQYENKKEEKSYFQQMEEAALKAFKKDVEKDSSLVSQYNDEVVTQKMKQFEEKRLAEEEGTSSSQPSNKGVWHEAKSPEGYTYYWNDVTGVSQWEKPEDFVLLTKSEDKQTKANEESKEEEEKEGSEDKSEEKESSKKRKADAYGGWTTVETEENGEVDLQLPQNNATYMSMYKPQVEQRQPQEDIEFGEKKVTSLAKPGSAHVNVGFKKRKMNKGSRALRQREDS